MMSSTHSEMDHIPAPAGAEDVRVAIISDAVPQRNGVGSYYCDLVEHLRERVERAELICPDCPSGGRAYLTLPLPGDHTQKICVPPAHQLVGRLRRLAPHVIVIPTPGPYGLFGAGLARRLGANLVVGFHTHYEGLTNLYSNPLLRAISRWYFRACNRRLFQRCSIVLTNSHQMATTARRIGARNVDLMGTLIPRRFLEHPLSPLSGDVGRVLFAGRLAPEKNIDAVFDAAARMPGRHFLIAGDGPLRRYVTERAAVLPNLAYLGWLSRDKMLETLDSVDALVLPSHVESFGTIAMEGMARGRVVLVSSNCGILEWPSLSRALFPVRPDETLAAAVQRITGLGQEMIVGKARRGSQAVREINAWSLERWLRVLARCLLPA